MARTIKRKHLVSRSHVTLQGPVVLSGHACVGGNLRVDGDLTVVGPLMCLGRITVHGNLTANTVIIAGRGLEVRGHLSAADITAYSPYEEDADFTDVAQVIASTSPTRLPDEDDPALLAALVDEDTLSDIGFERHDFAIDAASCHCFGITAHGAMRVRDHLYGEIIDALGMPLQAGSLSTVEAQTGALEIRDAAHVDDELYCFTLACARLISSGSVVVEEGLIVHGRDLCYAEHAEHAEFAEQAEDMLADDDVKALRSDDLEPALRCHDLAAGSIEVRGSINADGQLRCTRHLRADRSITACGGITVGAHHCVLAGLGVPMNQWDALGFVSAPTRPARLRSGAFRPLGRRERHGMRQPVAMARKKRRG